MITLERPNVKYKDSYLSYLDECRAFNDVPQTALNDWWRFVGKMNIDDFDAYVADLTDFKNGSKAKSFNAEFHEFWMIEDGQFVGEVDIRPILFSDTAKNLSGHVGCVMRPSAAGRGLPIFMWGQISEVLRSFGLKQVLLTCYPDNSRSARVCRFLTQKFGGYEEPKIIEAMRDGKLQRRRHFWVNVTTGLLQQQR